MTVLEESTRERNFPLTLRAGRSLPQNRVGNVSEPAKPKDEGRSIPVGIGTAILLFGFILQFFSVRQSLPIEIQIVSAVFVGATAFLFAVWAWYPPLARYRSERKHAGKEDRISRESLAKFQSYVELLKNMCSPQRIDTLVYNLNTLKGQSDFAKLPSLYPWTFYVDSLSVQLAGLFDLLRNDEGFERRSHWRLEQTFPHFGPPGASPLAEVGEAAGKPRQREGESLRQPVAKDRERITNAAGLVRRVSPWLCSRAAAHRQQERKEEAEWRNV